MAELQITTENGFTCSVDEQALDDIRVFEALVQMNDKKAGRFEQLKSTLYVITALMGEEGKENLYSFLEEKNGRATAEAVGGMIAEIFAAIGEARKKS